MKSELHTSECLLSFASETTKAATWAPRHLQINCSSRLLRRNLPPFAMANTLISLLPAIFRTFLEDVALAQRECWEHINRLSARTSASAREQSTPFCGGAGRLIVQANSVLCFLAERVPLEGGRTVGRLCLFRSFKSAWLRRSEFMLDTASAQECFLPSLLPAAKIWFFESRENVEISSLAHQSPLRPPPCFILLVRWVMAFVFWSFSLDFFSELTLFPPASFSPLSSFSLSHAKGAQWTE